MRCVYMIGRDDNHLHIDERDPNRLVCQLHEDNTNRYNQA
jgi:hypothetical protein